MSTNQAQYFECFKNGFDFIKMLPCISAQALYGKLPEKHHISVVCSTILRKQSAYNT